MKNKYEISEELLEKIISSAYDDAGYFQKIRIKILALKHKEIAGIYNEYKKTAEAVHHLNEKAPEKVIENVYKKIELKDDNNFLIKIYSFFFGRPLLTSAALGIVILAISFLMITKNPEPEVLYTKAEIELAEKQVKESLAIVGKVFKKTQNILEEDILHDKVSKPVNKSINVLNKLFVGGS